MATVLCDDWVHGCGLARFNGQTVMVVGASCRSTVKNYSNNLGWFGQTWNKPVEALALTADKLKELGVVEYVVDEGEGAHLQPFEVMEKLKDVLKQAAWNDYSPMTAEDRCEARYQV
ncbi:hypothetical protein FQR65_LT18082 [Abscondita terminalis]|nr:hypothetical protein FQR65_LT18082 [Abscondita terminalis]